MITGSQAPKSELLTALLYPASQCRPLDQETGVVSSLRVPGSAETLRGHLPGVLPLRLSSLCHSAAGPRRPLCSAFLLNKRSTEYFPLGRDLPLPPGPIGPDYQRVRKPRLFFMEMVGARRPEGHGEFKEPKENLTHCSLPGSSSLGPPQLLLEFLDDTGLILVFQLFPELPSSTFLILSK